MHLRLLWFACKSLLIFAAVLPLSFPLQVCRPDDIVSNENSSQLLLTPATNIAGGIKYVSVLSTCVSVVLSPIVFKHGSSGEQTELVLSNRILQTTFTALSEPEHQGVTHVTVRNTQLNTITATALSSMLTLNSQLLSLDLTSSLPMDTDRLLLLQKVMSALGKHTNIHSLNLANNAIVDEDMALIAKTIGQTPTITKLGLAYNHISAVGIEMLLRSQRRHTTLKSLVLSGNKRVAALKRSRKPSSLGNELLKTLFANINNRDSTTMSLQNAQFTTLSAIEHFECSRCGITDEGIMYLIQSIKSGTNFLREIHLNENDISEQSVELLADAIKKHNGMMHTISFAGSRGISGWTGVALEQLQEVLLRNQHNKGPQARKIFGWCGKEHDQCKSGLCLNNCCNNEIAKQIRQSNETTCLECALNGNCLQFARIKVNTELVKTSTVQENVTEDRSDDTIKILKKSEPQSPRKKLIDELETDFEFDEMEISLINSSILHQLEFDVSVQRPDIQEHWTSLR